MQEVYLKDNYKCKYPNSDPVIGKCKLDEHGLCNPKCHNHGVCATCQFYSISSPSNECFECHFYEGIKNNPNLIKVNKRAEGALVRAVKEKDGYINGNNIER